jgi:hypothetical protein
VNALENWNQIPAAARTVQRRKGKGHEREVGSDIRKR